MPPVAGAASDAREVVETIRRSVEQLRSTGRVKVAGQPVLAEQALPAIYEARGFRPLWQDAANEEGLLGEISAAGGDGLNPADYHFAALRQVLERRAADVDDPRTAATADLLLTDALLRLAAHLHFGKVDPASGQARWDLQGNIRGRAATEVLARMASGGGLAVQLNELRPTQPMYGRLKSALARYRVMEQQGGWPALPAGRVLQAGMDDPRVVVLRQRLAVTDDFRGPVQDSTLFEPALEEALRGFQVRHGLQPDGLLGPATLRALNVPVEQRIAQLRANLERARWLLSEVRGQFLLIDPAARRLVLMDNSQSVLTQTVDFGPAAGEADEFRAEIRYFVVNPDWVLPVTLARAQVAPLARGDPAQLAAQGIEVFDQSGRLADPARVDWSRPAGWVVRQSPHPRSFLGPVRFAMPNERQIFLHGGPEEGAALPGSVRTEDAVALAAALAGTPGAWTAETVRAAVDAGRPASFSLSVPVPVLYGHWTVWIGGDGTVNFRQPDAERDARIIAALALAPPGG